MIFNEWIKNNDDNFKYFVTEITDRGNFYFKYNPQTKVVTVDFKRYSLFENYKKCREPFIYERTKQDMIMKLFNII